MCFNSFNRNSRKIILYNTMDIINNLSEQKNLEINILKTFYKIINQIDASSIELFWVHNSIHLRHNAWSNIYFRIVHIRCISDHTIKLILHPTIHIRIQLKWRFIFPLQPQVLSLGYSRHNLFYTVRTVNQNSDQVEWIRPRIWLMFSLHIPNTTQFNHSHHQKWQ